MDARAKQILPPASWETFEELCLALYRAIWKDSNARRHGRRGQAQHGVDVYGSRDGAGAQWFGVQAKGKDQALGAQLTEAELVEELARAEGFDPKLGHWTLATTAPRDAAIQAVARRLSTERVEAGRFPIAVAGWEDIRELLLEHPAVLQVFYPEVAHDTAGLVSDLRKLVGGAAATPQALWRPVTFSDARDLGPALSGRPLGAADVDACPELPEVSLLVTQLDQAFSARLEGPPGSGKSVSALQAARRFETRGWSVLSLEDPRAAGVRPPPDSAGRRLLLIDNAHLMAAPALEALEAGATADRLVLSIHNAEGKAGGRGAVVMDPKRGVKVIAAALRADRERTLQVVRRIDDRVGDRPHDELLDHRLEAAEAADHPWQFCFVLGGGWRRAAANVDAARAAKADLVLAAFALHQVASRDAKPAASDIAALVAVVGVDAAAFADATAWLLRHRLLLAPEDLRTPHQRFAVVALRAILAGQDRPGREAVGELLNHTLVSPSHPILGLHRLLSDWLHLDQKYVWTQLVDLMRIEPLIARCWAAVTPLERRDAMILLTGLHSYLPDGLAGLVRDRRELLCDWFSRPEHPTGQAIGWFVNAVRYKDEDLARELICAADPVAVAAAVSSATVETAYELAGIFDHTHTTRTEAWNTAVATALDRPALLRLAQDWPAEEDVFAYAELINALAAVEPDFALEMTEAFTPAVRRGLARDPIDTFHALNDVFSHVLRVMDVLGFFRGKNGPDPRRKAIARGLLADLDAKTLAATISAAPKRSFQVMAWLLDLIHDLDRPLFRRTVRAVDLERLDRTISEDWGRPFHDLEVLLAVICQDTVVRDRVRGLLGRNAGGLRILPARFALLFPELAITHLASGGEIDLSRWSLFARRHADAFIRLVAVERPDLLDALLRPSEEEWAKDLSQRDPSFYEDGAALLAVRAEFAPAGLQRMLEKVDAATASVGWRASLAKGGEPARSVAYLVEAAIGRADAAGELARKLRKRFPKASLPPPPRPGPTDLAAVGWIRQA